ncbi:MAG: ArsR/SmtB family transcription factor [Acidithiobacillus sp.]
MDSARIAGLLGSPTRMGIVYALIGGEALPAGELAYRTGVTPQTASHHLARMVEAKLLAVEQCLRYRYYRIAGPEVAEILENLLALSTQPCIRDRPDRTSIERLHRARTCYDHLAGKIAVDLANAMMGKGWLVLQDRDFQVTDGGEKELAKFGLDVPMLHRQQRLFARRCIDWSERRPHIGGALGSALLQAFEQLGWIRRKSGDRKIWTTSEGQRGFWLTFGVEVNG